MNPTKCIGLVVSLGILSAAVWLAPATAKGLTVTWDVDPAASSFQLTVPDQEVYVAGIGNITVLFRDAGNNNQWTDAGGRRAYVDGTITTHYVESNSITFLSGSNNLYALEQVSLRPNPGDWDALAYSYTNTTKAFAAVGAKVRGTYVVIIPVTFDVAFLALREVRFNMYGEVPITGNAFPGGQTQFGIAAALADVDGLELPLGLGQPVPDLYRTPMSQVVATNNLGGTVENLGGRSRKLTYNVSMPITMDLQGTILNGSGAGQIVAYATLPEPPPLRIEPSTNQTVIIAWPASVTGAVLEESPTLEDPTWTTVTNSPVTVGSEQQVTLPAAANAGFYRLRSE